jgi:Haem-binding domain
MATLRSAVTWLIGLLLVLFAAIQLVRPERSNPASDPGKAMAAHLAVPSHVASIFDRSCRDCHSHQTSWPWYSQVAPASWLVAHDVEEGREHLNFSTWADLGALDQRKTLEEICKEVRKGGMPIKLYLIVHRDAALTPSDVDALCGWTAAAIARLAAKP